MVEVMLRCEDEHLKVRVKGICVALHEMMSMRVRR